MKEAIRSLLALVLLAGFIELLLPHDQMRRYSRMVVGLLVLFSLLQLIMTTGTDLSGEVGGLGLLRSGGTPPISTQEVIREGRRIRESVEKKTASALKQRVEKKLSEVLTAATGIKNNRTELVVSEGRVLQVKIYLYPDTVVSEKYIKRLVSEILDIDGNLVEVTMGVEGGYKEGKGR